MPSEDPTVRISFALALLAAALVSTGAAAFDKEGKYTVHGAGDSDCREWMVDRNLADAGAWQLQQWLLGYVTAYNEWVRGSIDVLGDIDAKAFFAEVDDYCGANQNKTLYDAVADFVEQRR